MAWLRGRLAGAAPTRPEPPAPAIAPPPPPPSRPTELREALREARFDEARAILRASRDADDEADVLEAALAGSAAIAIEGASVDRFRIELAEALVARGARARACDVLEPATTPAAWVLRADLLAEGLAGPPTSHDLDRAIALLARALRADIDTPGARERWERLRARVGGGPAIVDADLGHTLLASGGALPYLLRREVARGGAGVVYEAEERLGRVTRTLALKIAHAGGAAREQLASEARVAVRFRGPAVVPILDVDPDAGWLATPWMAGMSLRERLRAPDARFAKLAEAPLDWLVPLLDALAAVHDAGFVHGDVKPANVLFDDDGAPWLSDFALARPHGAPATPGSAGYVSPERVAGAPASPRDDVFGVGRILDEIVAAGWGADRRDPLARVAALATSGALADARALRDALARS